MAASLRADDATHAQNWDGRGATFYKHLIKNVSDGFLDWVYTTTTAILPRRTGSSGGGDVPKNFSFVSNVPPCLL
jgi:hypothetical protein